MPSGATATPSVRTTPLSKTFSSVAPAGTMAFWAAAGRTNDRLTMTVTPLVARMDAPPDGRRFTDGHRPPLARWCQATGESNASRRSWEFESRLERSIQLLQGSIGEVADHAENAVVRLPVIMARTVFAKDWLSASFCTTTAGRTLLPGVS